VRDGREHPLSLCVPSGERRSTELSHEGDVFRTVEHLLSALAGLSLHEGVVLEVEGEEVPLVDGGALAFAQALASLGVAPSPPRLRVAKAGELSFGKSHVVFAVADDVRVEVKIDFGDARLAPHAAWDGTPSDFLGRIASARTFGFAHELGELARRGLASHVAKESVVLVTDDGILSAGEPFAADEPARHKLLDLLGDLFVWGGPPVGHVSMAIPGHAATHALVAKAIAAGLLVRS
jgi:UDP-3-O-[3-hydroxymyristoyl] N-acetylglucosamine deacetylase